MVKREEVPTTQTILSNILKEEDTNIQIDKGE